MYKKVPHRGQPDPEMDHPGPVELLSVAESLQFWLLPAPAVSHGNRMVTRWWGGCFGIPLMPLVHTMLLYVTAFIHFFATVGFMGIDYMFFQRNRSIDFAIYW